MRDAPWYTDDWFGLKSLDQETGGAGLVGTISALLCSALLLVAARQDKKIDFFSTPGNRALHHILSSTVAPTMTKATTCASRLTSWLLWCGSLV